MTWKKMVIIIAIVVLVITVAFYLNNNWLGIVNSLLAFIQEAIGLNGNNSSAFQLSSSY